MTADTTRDGEIADRIAELLRTEPRMACRDIATRLGLRSVGVMSILRGDVRFEQLHNGDWQLTRTPTSGPPFEI